MSQNEERGIETIVEKAERLYNSSFDEQEKGTDEASTENELRFLVAYFSGYREAIRKLFRESIRNNICVGKLYTPSKGNHRKLRSYSLHKI
jgi:hypothetical protein